MRFNITLGRDLYSADLSASELEVLARIASKLFTIQEYHLNGAYVNVEGELAQFEAKLITARRTLNAVQYKHERGVEQQAARAAMVAETNNPETSNPESKAKSLRDQLYYDDAAIDVLNHRTYKEFSWEPQSVEHGVVDFVNGTYTVRVNADGTIETF